MSISSRITIWLLVTFLITAKSFVCLKIMLLMSFEGYVSVHVEMILFSTLPSHAGPCNVHLRVYRLSGTANVCICIGFVHLSWTQTELLLHQLTDATTFLQVTCQLILGFLYVSAKSTTCGRKTLPCGGMIVCLYRDLSNKKTKQHFCSKQIVN